MGFIESFIECMQNAGVQGDLNSVGTDEQSVRSAVDKLKNTYGGVQGTDKEVVDAITKDLDGAAIIEAAGAAEFKDVINASVGWTVADILQYCDQCLEQAAQAGEGGGT